jgi:hypothetical protein
MELDKKLHDDIKAYCKLNGLKMNDYINKLLRQAFNIDKYGISPFSQSSNTIVEVEKEEVPQKKEKKSKKNVVEDNTINEDGIKVVKIERKKRILK